MTLLFKGHQALTKLFFFWYMGEGDLILGSPSEKPRCCQLVWRTSAALTKLISMWHHEVLSEVPCKYVWSWPMGLVLSFKHYKNVLSGLTHVHSHKKMPYVIFQEYPSHSCTWETGQHESVAWSWNSNSHRGKLDNIPCIFLYHFEYIILASEFPEYSKLMPYDFIMFDNNDWECSRGHLYVN